MKIPARLVIFDLDGTMIDSVQDIAETANIVGGRYNCPVHTIDSIKAHLGDGLRALVRGILSDERARDVDLVEQIAKEFLSEYDQHLLTHTRFYPGVEQFLDLFAERNGIKVGIVSNKPEYQSRQIIRGLGLEECRFVQIFGGDTFEVKKPDPKPLNEMIRLAEVQPNQTVMIGDSRADVLAAQAAGTQFIGVTFGYNPVDKLQGFGAQIFIDSFEQLPGLLI